MQSLILFIIDNSNNFPTDLEVHGLHAKRKNQLFILNTNLTSVEKCYIAALLGEDDKKRRCFVFSVDTRCRRHLVHDSLLLCEERCTRQE